MTIQDLEYFSAVCRHGSISRAAKSLYITPQGLSKAIKNLEHELNTRLLNRSSSGITLTGPGQYLQEHLDDFLGHYYSLRRGILSISERERHEIDLLSAYGILRLVSPDCLAAFQKEYPRICLHYREYPDKQVERLFASWEGNVAFTIGPVSSPGYSVQVLDSFEIRLLVNRRHPLSQRKSVTIRDLMGEPLYLESSEFQIYHLITGRCREAGFQPNILFETSGFSLCHKMVSQNRGISVTVDFIFEDMRDPDLLAIPFSDGDYRWSVCMLTRKEDMDNPDLLLFRNHILSWMEAAKAGKTPPSTDFPNR